MSNWPDQPAVPPEPLQSLPPLPPLPLPARPVPVPHVAGVGGVPPMGWWGPQATGYVPGTVDAQGRVARDENCRGCGYNLRGLPVEGRCPECGRAVGLSIVGDLLRYSDPDWLAKLRRGVNIILIGVLAWILVSFAAAAMRAGGPRAASAQAGSPATLLGLGAQALGLIGTWLLTTPDPSGIGEDLYGTSRNLIRVMLLIGLVQPLVNAAIPVVRPSLEVARVMGLIGASVGLAKVVGEFALLHYLGKLAGRIPDRHLAERAYFLKWALGVSYGLMVIFVLIAFVLTPVGGAARAAAVVPFVCFTGLAALAVIIFGVMYLFMLNRFRQAFQQQEDVARQTWAAATAAAEGA